MPFQAKNDEDKREMDRLMEGVVFPSREEVAAGGTEVKWWENGASGTARNIRFMAWLYTQPGYETRKDPKQDSNQWHREIAYGMGYPRSGADPVSYVRRTRAELEDRHLIHVEWATQGAKQAVSMRLAGAWEEYEPAMKKFIEEDGFSLLDVKIRGRHITRAREAAKATREAETRQALAGSEPQVIAGEMGEVIRHLQRENAELRQTLTELLMSDLPRLRKIVKEIG